MTYLFSRCYSGSWRTCKEAYLTSHYVIDYFNYRIELGILRKLIILKLDSKFLTWFDPDNYYLTTANAELTAADLSLLLCYAVIVKALLYYCMYKAFFSFNAIWWKLTAFNFQVGSVARLLLIFPGKKINWD